MSGQTSGPAGLKARHYTGKPWLSRLWLVGWEGLGIVQIQQRFGMPGGHTQQGAV